MNSLVPDLERELTNAFAIKQVSSTDAPARQAIAHRQAIARHEQDIITAERNRDLRVRSYESDLAELRRSFLVEQDRLERAIDEEKQSAQKMIDDRRRITRAFEAALAILEPNEAEREAPMADRMVPRPDVPVQRHLDIRS